MVAPDMNTQKIYSLAIQALHERMERLMQEGISPNAIIECMVAIRELEQFKEMDLFLQGLCDGKFDATIKPPDP